MDWIFLTAWLYDDNAAFLLLETQDAMDELYKKAEGSYFEQLIKECLIDNSFGVVAMAVPKTGLDAENEEKTAEKLRVYKDSLSKEEIEENCASHKGVKRNIRKLQARKKSLRLFLC